MQATPIKSLAVFCGSKNGVNAVFSEQAIQLGNLMAEYGVTLVYGGGSVGIMGTIADTIIARGGKAIGVIPQVLVDWERQHRGLTQLLVVEDMHTRKKKMYDLCDAAIVLPGGFGTLDELFEMVTWNQLSIHDKQIYILNSAGFYDHLAAHIMQMQREGFLYEAASERLTVISEPSDMKKYFES